MADKRQKPEGAAYFSALVEQCGKRGVADLLSEVFEWDSPNLKFVQAELKSNVAKNSNAARHKNTQECVARIIAAFDQELESNPTMTKSEYEKLSYMNNIRLRMHIMLCKPCLLFSKQNKLITQKYDELLAGENSYVLSEKKKNEVRNNILKKLEKET